MTEGKWDPRSLGHANQCYDSTGEGFCLSNDMRAKGARLQRSGLFNPGGCPPPARRGARFKVDVYRQRAAARDFALNHQHAAAEARDFALNHQHAAACDFGRMSTASTPRRAI